MDYRGSTTVVRRLGLAEAVERPCLHVQRKDMILRFVPHSDLRILMMLLFVFRDLQNQHYPKASLPRWLKCHQGLLGGNTGHKFASWNQTNTACCERVGNESHHAETASAQEFGRSTSFIELIVGISGNG